MRRAERTGDGEEGCVCLCLDRDLDGTAQSLKGVESEKEELNSVTTLLQKSIEVL